MDQYIKMGILCCFLASKLIKEAIKFKSTRILKNKKKEIFGSLFKRNAVVLRDSKGEPMASNKETY